MGLRHPLVADRAALHLGLALAACVLAAPAVFAEPAVIVGATGLAAPPGEPASKPVVRVAAAVDGDASTAGGSAALVALRGKQVPLYLDAGPFPRSGHPNALAYVPPQLTGAGPVDLVVFFHGWRGCAQVIMNDEEAPCSRGGDSTHAYHLADAMAASGKDAVLLIVQGPYDERSFDDGQLAAPGGFARIVEESLARLAQAAGSPATAPPLRVGSIQIFGHSGAGKAVADALDRGGLDDHVVEVDLLDALYDDLPVFERWQERVAREAADAPGTVPRRRFVVVYTCCAGTDDNSRQLARQPLPPAALARAGRPLRVVDHTVGPLPPAALAAPILILQTDVDHDPLPLEYFEPLVATSALRAAPAK